MEKLFVQVCLSNLIPTMDFGSLAPVFSDLGLPHGAPPSFKIDFTAELAL
jgi:hypothetical protein